MKVNLIKRSKANNMHIPTESVYNVSGFSPSLLSIFYKTVIKCARELQPHCSSDYSRH